MVEPNPTESPTFESIVAEKSKAPIYAAKFATFVLAASFSKSFVGHGWFGGWVFFPGAWYVGPLFGAVILIWQARSLKDFFSLRTFAFIGFATLIWAWVLYEGQYHSNFRPAPWRDFDRFMKDPSYYTKSSLPWYLDVDPGLLCAVLLPMAHGLSFRVHRLRIVIAVPVSILSYALFNNNLFSLAGWQATYLFCMFSPRPDILTRIQKQDASEGE